LLLTNIYVFLLNSVALHGSLWPLSVATLRDQTPWLTSAATPRGHSLSKGQYESYKDRSEVVFCPLTLPTPYVYVYQSYWSNPFSEEQTTTEPKTDVTPWCYCGPQSSWILTHVLACLLARYVVSRAEITVIPAECINCIAAQFTHFMITLYVSFAMNCYE
jgi:hypothetical protein